MSDELLKFEPSYSIGLGYHAVPMLSNESSSYIVANLFLIRELQLDKANLLGVVFSANTRCQTQVLLSPLNFYSNNIYVSPNISIGIIPSPNKLGFRIVWFLKLIMLYPKNLRFILIK